MNLCYYVHKNHKPQENNYEIYWIAPEKRDHFRVDHDIEIGTWGGLMTNGVFAVHWNSLKVIPADAKYIKIRMCVEEDDNTMAKRIGTFTNPSTGETDWLEPDTVNMIILQPRMVTRVGETNQTAIDFKLEYDEVKDVIGMTAEYSASGTKYISDTIDMDCQKFADQFADKIYADVAFDEANIIKDAKEKAVQNLTSKLMDNSILMGGMQFNGFGFITVDGDKVLTIEGLDFEYRVEGNRGVKSAVLRNCVGQASLKNLDNPEIKFWTGTYLVELAQPEVTTANEGRLKDYTLTIGDIIMKPDMSMPDHTKFDSPDFNDEEFLEKFVSDRRSLLDEGKDDDKELEDRLGDIFNF